MWSFQETIHDIWNLDIASPPILTSIYKDNKYIDVVVAPSKTGNTLILDRLSGKPIFEYRLEKVQASSIPGERELHNINQIFLYLSRLKKFF